MLYIAYEKVTTVTTRAQITIFHQRTGHGIGSHASQRPRSAGYLGISCVTSHSQGIIDLRKRREGWGTLNHREGERERKKKTLRSEGLGHRPDKIVAAGVKRIPDEEFARGPYIEPRTPGANIVVKLLDSPPITVFW